MPQDSGGSRGVPMTGAPRGACNRGSPLRTAAHTFHFSSSHPSHGFISFDLAFCRKTDRIDAFRWDSAGGVFEWMLLLQKPFSRSAHLMVLHCVCRKTGIPSCPAGVMRTGGILCFSGTAPLGKNLFMTLRARHSNLGPAPDPSSTSTPSAPIDQTQGTGEFPIQK